MARLIDSTLGHQTQLSKLMFLLENQRYPQSMLFVGPSGIGKKRVAMGIAQALVCEKSNLGCGECGPCLRIEKQQSESLFIVQSDPENTKPAIKVDDIRRLLESLSLTAVWGKRVVIIDDAHFMNEQASNALLKSLEEPDSKTFFILIANEIQQLLPTIRSRVQIIRFASLSYDQVRTIKPNLPDWAYRSCRGQIDRLMSLTTKQGLEERQEALDLFTEFCFNDEFLLHDQWRKSIREDRNWALFNIKCWLQITRDAMIIKGNTTEFLINTDQTELLKQMSAISPKKLAWFSNQLVQAARDINANQDSALVIDSLRVNYARMD